MIKDRKIRVRIDHYHTSSSFDIRLVPGYDDSPPMINVPSTSEITTDSARRLAIALLYAADLLETDRSAEGASDGRERKKE